MYCTLVLACPSSVLTIYLNFKCCDCLADCRGRHFSNMISFLADLKNGQCGDVKIRVDRLQVC